MIRPAYLRMAFNPRFSIGSAPQPSNLPGGHGSRFDRGKKVRRSLRRRGRPWIGERQETGSGGRKSQISIEEAAEASEEPVLRTWLIFIPKRARPSAVAALCNLWRTLCAATMPTTWRQVLPLWPGGPFSIGVPARFFPDTFIGIGIGYPEAGTPPTYSQSRRPSTSWQYEGPRQVPSGHMYAAQAEEASLAEDVVVGIILIKGIRV